MSAKASKVYHTARYEKEKLAGIRRPSGAKKLERITPLHRTVIALHLKGLSNNDIAARIKRTPAWVSTILNDPLVIEELEKLYEEQDGRLRMLMKDAVDTVREGMKAPKTQDRLRAADMVFKTQGKYQGDQGGPGKDSAENIISAILNRTEIHVHTGGDSTKVVESRGGELHQEEDQLPSQVDPEQ